MSIDRIKTEAKFFERSKAAWLATYGGKVALIKGEKLYGTFDTEQTAIKEGHRLFRLEPFFVKRIEPHETKAMFPALAVGIAKSE